jgi:hypothetical protein
MVAYNDTEKKRIPSKVLVLVFKGDADSITLPALQITNSETGATAETTCTYTSPSTTDEACIACAVTGTNTNEKKFPIYLTSSQPDQEGVLRYILTDNASHAYTVKGLSYSEEYVVAVQYENGGKRSNCFTSTPARTASLSELNGAPEAELKNPKCFIATAAYGSPFDSHIATLVWWRDNVLEKFSIGRWLVDHYYQVSPALAATISNSPSMQTLVRSLLWLPVTYMALLKFLTSFPLMYVNGGGALLVAGLSSFLLRRRQRLRIR